ncbi:hypothetical protein CCHR01_17906 [Colletotrichum chrysophilum]|uniref:Uncharacterized protein n=1 Tax=Colletotrichum chrysophilum TaxID=1836956 RepID=A0AAD9A199_9PEZI|nr:hypothetical protein CCHR01_17906 [Colletotrichum chrysophilum]
MSGDPKQGDGGPGTAGADGWPAAAAAAATAFRIRTGLRIRQTAVGCRPKRRETEPVAHKAGGFRSPAQRHGIPHRRSACDYDWDLPHFWPHKQPASLSVWIQRGRVGFVHWFLAPVTDRKRDETQRKQEERRGTRAFVREWDVWNPEAERRGATARPW